MNIKIVGILDKNEEGKYIVTVENKDVGSSCKEFV